MPLTYLEHFLIQTTDFEATCDWYERVLGLERGYTPDFKFPVQWMYLGERDVGEITSGSFSPVLGHSIAMARVAPEVYDRCTVEVRGKQLAAKVVVPPFVRHGRACYKGVPAG